MGSNIFRFLEVVETTQAFAVTIGIMSMMTVVMTIGMIYFDYAPSFSFD